MKLSKDKITLPGRKQVYRYKDSNGDYVRDLIGIADERADGDPLLFKVMEHGKVQYDFPLLSEIREKTSKNLSHLPDKYKKLITSDEYPVELSKKLEALTENLKKELRASQSTDGNL
jgi:nicotinate phosphoribosyltransferase